MASGPPPDYYAILEVSDTATTQQVRDAYKRAALKTHPDRVAANAPERAERTRKFQIVNDAYYTLSDSVRRREYDTQRKFYHETTPADPFDSDAETEVPPEEDQNAYSWAWNYFTNNAAGGAPPPDREETGNEQFGDVFDEMMRDEGMAEGDGARPTGKFWALLGSLSGGALGFIVANVPGMVAGAVAGNRLGAVRDAKGKSVYAVFQELPQDDRTRLLSQLAARVFSHAVGI